MTVYQAYSRSNLFNCTTNVPRFPVFPVKTTYFYIARMSPNVCANILERHTPYRDIFSTGNKEQSLKTIDIKGLNTFPLYFSEGEHCKKGEHHGFSA